MRVAVVHYHLKRGGVTRVVDSSLRGLAALETPPRCVVLSGEPPAEDGFAGSVAVVEGLHYSNTRERDPAPDELLADLREAAALALGGPPDLWHFHNHALGKNGALPGVIDRLAREGEALLLQLHDFAEDGRPENYRLIESASGTERLYPCGSRVHYAVINGRDRSFLADTGIDPEHLHLLPNPVESLPLAAPPSPAEGLLGRLGTERLVLYPVRALRRKNLGEMLLWSALAEPGTLFANTLGPTNRAYVPAYERWKAFASSLGLPVRLGLAEEEEFGFGELVAASSCLLGTSLAEGFGLGFLEPWLFGKGVAGRDLPEITADFKNLGLDFSTLHGGVFVPEEWIRMDHLRRLLREQLETVYRSYGRRPPRDAVERALAAIRDGEGRVDFGGLDETLQEEVIARLARDPGSARDIAPQRLDLDAGPTRIKRNAKLVRRHFSTGDYARRLMELYLEISASRSGEVEWLPPAHLLDRFLDPARFRLLRT